MITKKNEGYPQKLKINYQKKSQRMEIGVPGAGERKREEEERRVLERVGISGGKNGEF